MNEWTIAALMMDFCGKKKFKIMWNHNWTTTNIQKLRMKWIFELLFGFCQTLIASLPILFAVPFGRERERAKLAEVKKKKWKFKKSSNHRAVLFLLFQVFFRFGTQQFCLFTHPYFAAAFQWKEKNYYLRRRSLTLMWKLISVDFSICASWVDCVHRVFFLLCPPQWVLVLRMKAFTLCPLP